MRWKKFSIFAITILSISIVVFNNLAQIIKEIFSPSFNMDLWIGFGIVVIAVITYAVINRDVLVKKQ